MKKIIEIKSDKNPDVHDLHLLVAQAIDQSITKEISISPSNGSKRGNEEGWQGVDGSLGSCLVEGRGERRNKVWVLSVTSRQVVWLFPEQLWFEFVPILHRLQGRLAAQG